MLDEENFEYTTFLGSKKKFRFADIKSVRRNPDSLTLYVRNQKIHIESCAVFSDRLFNKLSEIIEKM